MINEGNDATPSASPQEFVSSFLKDNRVDILFDGAFHDRSALRSAETPDQIEQYLSKEILEEQDILDDLASALQARGEIFTKPELKRALRKLRREARKHRKLEITRRLCIPVGVAHEKETAEAQWKRLAESAFTSDVQLVIAVLRHFVWQVKRKLLGRLVKHHLMPVVMSKLQGTGKTTFVSHFLAPLEELANGPVLLSDFADARSAEIYRFPVVILDDLEAINPSRVAVLKNLLTSSRVTRRRLGTSASFGVRQQTTPIGTANSSIEELVVDPTGYRRFAVLAFSNGEVANGGDATVWSVVDHTDYELLWRSVDPFEETPLKPHLELLFQHQAQYRPSDPLKTWLTTLDVSSDAVERITTRYGVRAKDLHELFVLQTDCALTLAAFGKSMAIYAYDPQMPFGRKIRTQAGYVYPLKSKT